MDNTSLAVITDTLVFACTVAVYYWIDKLVRACLSVMVLLLLLCFAYPIRWIIGVENDE